MRQKVLSWSHDYEDIILFHVFKNIENGFYFDIGANSPWDMSVTKFFYERNWRGINIEPLPIMHQELCSDRERDINLCIGAGSKKDTLSLFVAEGGGAGSTFNEELATFGFGKQVQISVPIETADNILKEYLSDYKQDIHFCKIDVEGFEKEVLEGFDFDRYRPWVFAMESTKPNTTIPNYDKWEHILTENGYDFVLMSGVNRYYIDNAKGHLKSRFISPKQLLEIHDIFHVTHQRLLDNKHFKLGLAITAPYRVAKKILLQIIRKISFKA
ncbi:MAG: FkbM family methyltransferase [Campylobacteraceae bacterium]|jgi:FkbM family methyltransferase|nr:FkbM family methyltransferase [Campylobacteraceae bacterium]